MSAAKLGATGENGSITPIHIDHYNKAIIEGLLHEMVWKPRNHPTQDYAHAIRIPEKIVAHLQGGPKCGIDFELNRVGDATKQALESRSLPDAAQTLQEAIISTGTTLRTMRANHRRTGIEYIRWKTHDFLLQEASESRDNSRRLLAEAMVLNLLLLRRDYQEHYEAIQARGSRNGKDAILQYKDAGSVVYKEALHIAFTMLMWHAESLARNGLSVFRNPRKFEDLFNDALRVPAFGFFAEVNFAKWLHHTTRYSAGKRAGSTTLTLDTAGCGDFYVVDETTGTCTLLDVKAHKRGSQAFKFAPSSNGHSRALQNVLSWGDGHIEHYVVRVPGYRLLGLQQIIEHYTNPETELPRGLC